MMQIQISKSDVLWSYIAQFFNIGAGFITLPLVLHMLSTEEIAMNYLMVTISTMVALIDFGFSPQFGRNVSYVFSGAQKLEKEGLTNNVTGDINYHLLACMIGVAKKVYMYMSLVVLFLMLTLGSWYIYSVTEGFNIVEDAALIWFLYSVSTFFNIYFYYYSSLLIGRGQVKEEKQAMMASRISNIVLVYILLLYGYGLIGVCIANLVSPFVGRGISYYYFYDKYLKGKLAKENPSKNELKNLFLTLWYNAKKLGINFVGAYAILKFSLFIAGLYLSLKEVSSMGLMMQLVAIISGISMTFFTSMFPRLTSIRINGDSQTLIREFSWTANVFYAIFIICSCGLVVFGPLFLTFIGANAELPSSAILISYLFVTLLEQNHSMFATLITTQNNVPFVTSGVVSGLIICMVDFLVLQFTSLGLMGLVLVQGIVQLCFNNWYWPHYVCVDLNVTYLNILKIGFSESLIRLNHYAKKMFCRV